jgi:hypothetical protein
VPASQDAVFKLVFASPALQCSEITFIITISDRACKTIRLVTALIESLALTVVAKNRIDCTV